jgi:hypothetical protein
VAGLRFRARILIRGANPYVHISRDRATALKPAWRKPMPVLVQINRQPKPPWRINMMPIGNGAFYLYLHGDVRTASATKVGDMVAVAVRFDPAYRGGPMHDLPPWFVGPLNASARAKRAWLALPPSRQKEILRYLSWLKSDAARARNVAKAIRVLSGAKLEGWPLRAVGLIRRALEREQPLHDVVDLLIRQIEVRHERARLNRGRVLDPLREVRLVDW